MSWRFKTWKRPYSSRWTQALSQWRAAPLGYLGFVELVIFVDLPEVLERGECYIYIYIYLYILYIHNHWLCTGVIQSHSLTFVELSWFFTDSIPRDEISSWLKRHHLREIFCRVTFFQVCVFWNATEQRWSTEGRKGKSTKLAVGGSSPGRLTAGTYSHHPFRKDFPWKITIQITHKHGTYKSPYKSPIENDLPNPYDYVPAVHLLGPGETLKTPRSRACGEFEQRRRWFGWPWFDQCNAAFDDFQRHFAAIAMPQYSGAGFFLKPWDSVLDFFCIVFFLEGLAGIDGEGSVCFKTSSPLSNDRCGCHFSLLCWWCGLSCACCVGCFPPFSPRSDRQICQWKGLNGHPLSNGLFILDDSKTQGMGGGFQNVQLYILGSVSKYMYINDSNFQSPLWYLFATGACSGSPGDFVWKQRRSSQQVA